MKHFILTILVVVVFMGCAAQEIKRDEPAVFYPKLPEQPRIQFLYTISNESDLEKKRSSFDEFLLGEEVTPKVLHRVYDIAPVRGKIYVSDRGFKQIIILDIEKNEFDYIDAKGEGTLTDPAGIWVGKDDVKYVTDMARKQVVVFDRENKYLRTYGALDQFGKPLDVAVFGNKVYVCDIDQHTVVVVNKKTGKTIQKIGGPGEAEGKLYKPTHITLDHEGNLFVNDSFNFRVSKFDPEGKYIKSFGAQGDTPGTFARPKGIAVDEEEHLYVVDTAFENVQIFDVNSGAILLAFGEHQVGPASLYLPAGIRIDYENTGYFQKFVDKNFKLKYLIYVGNMVGPRKLNVFGFGEWIGSPLEGTEESVDESSGEEKQE